MPSECNAQIRVGRTPPQQDVLASGLLERTGGVVQMATGSGKTWLAEQAMVAEARAGRRALYLAPLRALAQEGYETWRMRYPEVPVGVFTGDMGGQGRPPLSYRQARLMVMTPERLDLCTRHWRSHWHWLPEVSLVVVDELHLLHDEQRGPRLEGALGRLRRLNPFARIVGLSATLGNAHELAGWLGGEAYVSDWRPVPLTWRRVRFGRPDEKPDLLRQVVTATVQEGGRSLVFVQSRRRAEVLADVLGDHGLAAAHHHAGLGQRERSRVERSMRSGELEVVVATGTLEMGLNLPVRQVVLYDLQRFDGTGFAPLPVSSVWQRAGRAGRPGLDEAGEVVLFEPAWGTPADYESGGFEPVRSGLRRTAALGEQVIAEVASGLARTPEHVERALASTLGAAQDTLPPVRAVVGEMVGAGLLAEDRETDGAPRLRATRRGRIASRMLLTPATVSHLHATLTGPEAQCRSLFDRLLAVTAADDAQPVLPVDYEELPTLADTLSAEPSFLLGLPSRELAHGLGLKPKRLLSSLKMAAVLRRWTRTGEVAEVADAFGCYAHEVERLAENVARLLQAAGALFDIDDEEERPAGYERAGAAERLRALEQMVRFGLDEHGATLALVGGIGGTWARRLVEHDVADIEDLAQAEPEALARLRGLSLERATSWVDEAVDLLRSRPHTWFADEASCHDVTTAPWPADVDPYRLRRAFDLRVTREGSRLFAVSGGLEPHRVRLAAKGLRCDCADSAKGNLCKHVLAVRLRRGDRSFRQLAGRLRAASSEGRLNLFMLWYR